MAFYQTEALTFSGDETSDYHGGSEYFDIDVRLFRKMYPMVDYLVFCDNVFSNGRFNQCICRTGYMLRDTNDSREIYEPKTVKTSFTVDCDSRFAYLFALDLAENDFIWLNVARNSYENIAGETQFGFLTEYFDVASYMNMAEFFSMLATEVVEDIEEADVIVTDAQVTADESVEIIRSYDTERIIALMNS